MQLSLTTKIAGKKTVDDWNKLKPLLADFKNDQVWHTAYDDYYYARLKHRYLNPIEWIRDDGSFTGEGFAIMAIICSLIEFLESTYQGRNYRYRRKGDPDIGLLEYSGSEVIFVSFLTQRSPFANDFNAQLAEEFYKYVRCGLLHEARTNGNWTIWGTGHSLIKKNNNEIVVYRNNFFEATKSFITESKNELLNSDDRKEAFIRKFDNLCEM
jgi:hypothetical protein